MGRGFDLSMGSAFCAIEWKGVPHESVLGVPGGASHIFEHLSDEGFRAMAALLGATEAEHESRLGRSLSGAEYFAIVDTWGLAFHALIRNVPCHWTKDEIVQAVRAKPRDEVARVMEQEVALFVAQHQRASKPRLAPRDR